MTAAGHSFRSGAAFVRSCGRGRSSRLGRTWHCSCKAWPCICRKRGCTACARQPASGRGGDTLPHDLFPPPLGRGASTAPLRSPAAAGARPGAGRPGGRAAPAPAGRGQRVGGGPVRGTWLTLVPPLPTAGLGDQPVLPRGARGTHGAGTGAPPGAAGTRPAGAGTGGPPGGGKRALGMARGGPDRR